MPNYAFNYDKKEYNDININEAIYEQRKIV